MSERTYDAIVIGSGISGGWAAKELTEKGLRTLVLEAGRPIDPAKDYSEHVPASRLRFRGERDRLRLEREQPIQQNIYACDEHANKFFVNDADNPYTTPAEKPFRWIRGRQVGGRSITWNRQVYRLSDLDFEANVRDGVGVDWPIRYADIAPWYDYVEDFIGVSGQAEGLAHLPDGRFLPPMDMNAGELFVKAAMAKAFGRSRIMTMGRTAVLTKDHRGRAACHSCGPCHRGCSTRSYFSSLNVTLPAAFATGRLTLRPHSIVHSLVFDPETRRVSGVRVIDAETREALEFSARVVFVCASTIESSRILLASTSREFPTGLANSSGQLGRNLMDHVGGLVGMGVVDPGDTTGPSTDNRPNSPYIPRFRNLGRKDTDFVRGYGFQCNARREGWRRGASMRGFGPTFKQELSEPGAWRFAIAGFGDCLPSPANFVQLDREKKDAWGLAVANIQFSFGENEEKIYSDMTKTAKEVLEAAGATNISVGRKPEPGGGLVHEMGTARMGRDPKTSVLNGYNQAHDVANLFVTDGAAMTSTGCVNPSLTYMALTARACDWAVQRMKHGEL